MKDAEYSERGFQLLVDLDPETMLAKPTCNDDYRYHIHYANSLDEFKFKFNLGMQHFPKNFGFAFMTSKYSNNHGNTLQAKTPFSSASLLYHDEGDSTQLIIDCIMEYCHKK